MKNGRRCRSQCHPGWTTTGVAHPGRFDGAVAYDVERAEGAVGVSGEGVRPIHALQTRPKFGNCG